MAPDQIDLDVRTEVTKRFVKETLQQLVKHQASLIRLDAFAYAVKKLDTSDFFVEPEIWDLLDGVRQDLAGTDAQILPEIHEHYSLPRKVSEHGYFIYDFAPADGPALFPVYWQEPKAGRLAEAVPDEAVYYPGHP